MRRKKEATHLRMPALTTARTTAFMPALSPPEVRTASFIVTCCDIFSFTGPRQTNCRRKTGVGVGYYGLVVRKRLDKIQGIAGNRRKAENRASAPPLQQFRRTRVPSRPQRDILRSSPESRASRECPRVSIPNNPIHGPSEAQRKRNEPQSPCQLHHRAADDGFARTGASASALARVGGAG